MSGPKEKSQLPRLSSRRDAGYKSDTSPCQICSHLSSIARLSTGILLWFSSVAALWCYARQYPLTPRLSHLMLGSLGAPDELDYGEKTGGMTIQTNVVVSGWAAPQRNPMPVHYLMTSLQAVDTSTCASVNNISNISGIRYDRSATPTPGADERQYQSATSGLPRCRSTVFKAAAHSYTTKSTLRRT
ncbi:hypothetical protein EV401DRAFT_1340290 [Pisolithus croceorrhizus]|nr:hypothetical protein EV401DRAFT_1340290 [Pisolithus croceorrhizus]